MANILLIDDDIDLQTLYDTALKSVGHTVFIAGDGQQGLDIAGQNQIDLILLDLTMPILDGFGFLEQYSPKNHLGVKIIILTNAEDIDLVNRAMQMGVSNYIEKVNVTPMKMAEMVNDVLNNPNS